MKTINIGNKQFSKIVCGTNAFYARSHFSNARDSEYKTRFTDEYIEDTINFCIDNGINTVETSANERIWNIFDKIRKNRNLLTIGSTRIDETSSMRSHQTKLKFLIDKKSDICVIHSQFIERPSSINEIKGLGQLIDKIREANLLVGVSAHKISIIELCEKKYDIDTYLFPLNSTGFVYPGYDGDESVNDRISIVKNIDKPFILMKTLAAGRIPPAEGLQFALENSKKTDIITLGFGSIEEAEESIELVSKRPPAEQVAFGGPLKEAKFLLMVFFEPLILLLIFHVSPDFIFIQSDSTHTISAAPEMVSPVWFLF